MSKSHKEFFKELINYLSLVCGVANKKVAPGGIIFKFYIFKLKKFIELEKSIKWNLLVFGL